MNQTVYKIVKFTNGEEIICELSDEAIDGEYEIGFPLKMQIVSQPTQKGSIDSLNLSRWIEPYTEQKYFKIAKSAIITIASASFGLTKYYEHFQKKMELWEEDNIAESKSFMEEYTDEEIYDELLDSIETESKSIH